MPFIMVPCPCGRILRAKSDQVGSEIRCWNCQKTTVVLIPRSRQRVLLQCFRNSITLVRGAESQYIILAAGLLTLGFLVPQVGLGVVGILLIAAAAVYGNVIQIDDRSQMPAAARWRQIRRSRWDQWLLTVLFAATTWLPLWVIGLGTQQSPHFTGLSWLILLTAWGICPLLIAAAHAEPEMPGGGIRGRFDFLTSHPFTSVLILAIPPLSLLVLEAWLGGLMYLFDTLPFFAIEFMPTPRQIDIIHQIPNSAGVTYIHLPSHYFTDGYFDGIRHGYSFTAAFPASLSMPIGKGVDPVIVNLTPESAFGLRLFIVLLISLCLTTSFAVQARCWNVLVHARHSYVS